jgi:hypothetical protein
MRAALRWRKLIRDHQRPRFRAKQLGCITRVADQRAREREIIV